MTYTHIQSDQNFIMEYIYQKQNRNNNIITLFYYTCY